MNERFNGYEKTIADFSNEILVVCPNCKKKGDLKKHENYIKVTCLKCGYNKKYTDTLNRPPEKLWLSVQLKEDELWAYNLEHLEFIKNHISANLRERTLENISNKSIGSRLPKWMTSKNNRNDVLKAIEKLKNK